MIKLNKFNTLHIDLDVWRWLAETGHTRFMLRKYPGSDRIGEIRLINADLMFSIGNPVPFTCSYIKGNCDTCIITEYMQLNHGKEYDIQLELNDAQKMCYKLPFHHKWSKFNTTTMSFPASTYNKRNRRYFASKVAASIEKMYKDILSEKNLYINQ